MTFTSTAPDRLLPNSRSLEILKISTAASIITTLGVMLLQFLLWMPVSSPAEIPTTPKQVRIAIK